MDAALAELANQRRILRAQRERVAAAKRAVDALNRCDCCGVQVLPMAGAEVLCWPCTRRQIEAEREAARASLKAC